MIEKSDSERFQAVIENVCYFITGISVNTPKLSVIYKGSPYSKLWGKPVYRLSCFSRSVCSPLIYET